MAATNIPVTKAELQTELEPFRLDIATLKTDVAELKTDVAELKTDVKRLESAVKSNTLDIIHIKADIVEIKETMATKNDVSLILNAIDTFAAEAEAYRRKDLDRGHILMVHDDKLSSHETRITILEAKK